MEVEVVSITDAASGLETDSITKEVMCECVYAGMSGEYDWAMYMLCKSDDF